MSFLSSPTAHPSDEVLEDFVLGELHPLRRVLVEAHLAFCELCRRRVEQLTRPAASFLASEPEIAVPEGLWNDLALRLDGERDAAPADVLAETPLPVGARGELPRRESPLEWLPYGDGEATLFAGDESEQMGLYLVRTPPKLSFPYHVHVGGEEIVILTGGYRDAYGHLATGDFRFYGPGTAHAPRADPGEVCWAVALITGGIEMPDPKTEAAR